MADTAALYDDTRRSISDLVRSLPEEQLATPTPATPNWTVRDVVSHLSGDVACIIVGDFPAEFFASFGEADAVVVLNRWTDGHVESRRDRSLEEVLSEWEDNAKVLTAMMSGDKPWPDGVPGFSDRVILTDLAVHQQDINGALGRDQERDTPLIRIANAGYIATMGWRLATAGLPPLRLVTGDSERVAGDGEPAATVTGSRFELFRALSGRRNPDQIRSYEWDGDPEPYIAYFYPYGIREEALVE